MFSTFYRDDGQYIRLLESRVLYSTKKQLAGNSNSFVIVVPQE